MGTKTVDALVSFDGRFLGTAPVFEVANPWWSEVELVTARLDELLGVPTAVLRLLDAEDKQTGNGGRVTYHVEAARLPRPGSLDPTPRPEWAELTSTHPLRASWAEPNGPQELIDWAADSLNEPLAGQPTQVKTWNLSCLYRLPTAAESWVWAKATSRFLSVDGDIIRHVARYDADLAPGVLAVDPASRRSLLSHVRGIDCWEPDDLTLRDVLSRWVAVQAGIAADGIELRTPQLHPGDLASALEKLLVGDHRMIPEEEADGYRVLERLPGIVTALEESGLPQTLVHGDFHPGNWRSDGTTRKVVDWADSYHGHPAVDLERVLGYLSGKQRELAISTWTEAWENHLPGSAPERAIEPMRVVMRVLGALTYQRFLDNIEPSERIYHEGDPATQLRAAAELINRSR